MESVILILGIILAALSVIAVLYMRERLEDQKRDYEDRLHEIQLILDSKAKSSAAQRSTIKGQLAEQFYPIMGNCPFQPSDMRFLGDFCDYIVVDGYTDCKDNNNNYIKDVVFVEIKTGKSQLSRHQKLIRNAVQEGRVRWETVQL